MKSSIPASTRRLSLDKLRATGRAATAKAKIYRLLEKSAVPLSRSEISELLEMRLSTVCGQANVLIAEGRVERAGRAMDADSGREVQVLRATIARLKVAA